MPLELVKKIIDEVSAQDFQKKHRITKIEAGENGDALLNKDLIEILRYIKAKLPQASIGLNNSFYHFNKDLAKVILGEHLIDRFCCTVGGSNEEEYFIVKGLALNTVRKNIIDFLEVRKNIQNTSSLTIRVLTLNAYINVVRRSLGSYPCKLKNEGLRKGKDDFKIIKKQFKEFIDSKKDKVERTNKICLWAERENAAHQTINYKNYSCPFLDRIKSTAFIAPDGTWYACCPDADNELSLGDLNSESIDNIYSGEVRKNLIGMLEQKQFEKIGGPCKTVNCCQLYSSSTYDRLTTALKTNYPLLYDSIHKLKLQLNKHSSCPVS